MKFLIDMNLSPLWSAVFERHGWEAIHWSAVGSPHAPDRVLMDWARENRYVVFTHDLDFGALLAVTHAQGPSVIQIRTQDVTPDHLAPIVINSLRQYRAILETGALIIVDEAKARARILPLSL